MFSRWDGATVGRGTAISIRGATHTHTHTASLTDALTHTASLTDTDGGDFKEVFSFLIAIIFFSSFFFF
mgnify:CR=1 FL=1